MADKKKDVQKEVKKEEKKSEPILDKWKKYNPDK